MKRHHILSLCLLLVTSPFTFASDEKAPDATPMTYELGERYTLQSSALKESREIYVHVPDGYQDAQYRYPVLYLLDGNSHFQHAISASKVLSRERLIPPMLIVAIPNGKQTRIRDLGKQASTFRAFIADEVMPLVNAHYRTSGQNILFGHSMAGGFAIKTLAQTQLDFSVFIAASPVMRVSSEDPLGLFRASWPDGLTSAKRLYIAETDKTQEIGNAPAAIKRLVGQIESEGVKGLAWHYRFVEGHTHMTTPYFTLFDGLKWSFHEG